MSYFAEAYKRFMGRQTPTRTRPKKSKPTSMVGGRKSQWDSLRSEQKKMGY